jgi:hypothetical protein
VSIRDFGLAAKTWWEDISEYIAVYCNQNLT